VKFAAAAPEQSKTRTSIV